MTRRTLGLLAAAAAFAAFGGLHLEIASGRALDRPVPNDATLQAGPVIAATGVNRSAKGDRAEISASSVEGRTITFQHPDLPSTTVALRLWETVSSAKSRPTSIGRLAPAGKPRLAIACEGIVSMLTEAAKQLPAGRCVT